MSGGTASIGARLGRRARRGRERTAYVLRNVGPTRRAITALILVLAVLLARYSWNLPGTAIVERWLYDERASAVPRVAQDQRIAMVVYDDETRVQTGRISPLDRLILAKGLLRLNRLGPRAIGIDMLLDQPTPEDPALIAAFRQMRVPTYLGFTTNAANPEDMSIQREEFLRGLFKRAGSPNLHPASISLLTDGYDNVMRNWPDRAPGLPPLLANALTDAHPAFRRYDGPVRFRAPISAEDTVFAELTLQFITNPAIPDEVLRPLIEGRTILIGGQFEDIDRFAIPSTASTGLDIAGLEIHAHMLAQQLDGAAVPVLPTMPWWPASIAVILAGALTRLLSDRPWLLTMLAITQAAAVIGLPFWIQAQGIDTQGMPMLGWTIGWLIAFFTMDSAIGSIGAKEKKIAQSALGKYLPRDVANAIMRDPTRLALHGTKAEIYALFTDLEGFTKLSHAIEPEMVALLLNRYLEMLCDVVLRHGGTIDKFVGDAVVAFWGAPIARPDDAERAARAAIEMYQAGEEFRRSAPPGVPPIGVTRVGLHRGEAVVGNFGGEGRIQYTALGDSMNLAARLESANKQLKTRALVSETAVRGAGTVPFRPMGRIRVRGRATPIAVFEPVPDLSDADVTRLTALYARFDHGDVRALHELEVFSGAHPDDAAVANLVYRLREVGPGGSFALD